MLIRRITGSGFVKTGAITDSHPVTFTHWREVVNEFDSELDAASTSDNEEAVVELWLEDPMSFQAYFDEESADAVRVPQTRTAGSMVRRADNFGRKMAVVRGTNWDQEFADAQQHAASVLSKLGNGR